MTRIAIALALLAFLAAGAGAQELVGTWEHAGSAGTARLHLLADGVVTVASTGIVGLRDPEDPSTHALPETVTVEVGASGTWSADGERLTLTLPQRQLRIDGRSFDEELTWLAYLLARAAAAAQGLPEAAVDNLAALARIGLAARYNEEQLLDEAMGDLTAGQPYRLEGDTLWLADGDGRESAWERDRASAVASRTWAGVKAGSPWTR